MECRLGNVIKQRVITENGIVIEYTLHRSARKICGRYSYSVALHQTAGGEIERVYAADISRTKRGSERIFRLLTEGFVTACTFFEILDEIL